MRRLLTRGGTPIAAFVASSVPRVARCRPPEVVNALELHPDAEGSGPPRARACCHRTRRLRHAHGLVSDRDHVWARVSHAARLLRYRPGPHGARWAVACRLQASQGVDRAADGRAGLPNDIASNTGDRRDRQRGDLMAEDRRDTAVPAVRAREAPVHPRSRRSHLRVRRAHRTHARCLAGHGLCCPSSRAHHAAA